MNAPSPSMRELARRLLAASRSAPSAAHGTGGAPIHEAVAMCETLRATVTKFAGADGFAALLHRALALARKEVPALQSVRLGTNCHMEGLDEVAAGEGGADAAVALGAHLLTLLVTFIGESMTLRLIRDGWPELRLET